ncbi:hypothetical protein OB69_04075 [Roseivirga seohaensis subsp. aquiponti]|uniref:Uncharacterized protein n=1 Tax=Roseivirga seohaensis subsp. aquiponti TaxID=1566026 RepID=A0A0L8APA2_9BACT|nr:BF3164 family lipoprotein [Roseivirga seohaensis]KOF04164.1 hypothetical protein OB69_04075 [Roseivirga seohaensis subsp. aquiponti]
MTKIDFLRKAIFIPFFILTCCQVSNENDDLGLITDESFPKTVNLISNIEVDSIKIPTDLFRVNRLLSTKKHVIAYESSKKDTLFRVFDSTTGEYLGGFGFSGQGPLDLEFEQIVQSSISVLDDGLIVGDLKKLRKYEISGGKNDFSTNNIKLMESWKIPGGLLPYGGANVLGDTLLIGRVAFSNKHFVTYNINNNQMTDVLEFPNNRPEVPATASSALYLNTYNSNIDRTKVAIAYRYFPQIRIYNFKDEKFKDIYFSPKNEQIKSIEVDQKKSIKSSSLFSYYVNIEVSDKSIYALYSERVRHSNQGSPSTTEYFNEPEIHRFDWNGKPKTRIILPPNAFLYFTVTPDDSYLYFVKLEVSDYIFRYKIN